VVAHDPRLRHTDRRLPAEAHCGAEPDGVVPRGDPDAAALAGRRLEGPDIRTLRDVWLLPIYAAFNYYEQPFPPSELVRLSTYLGRTAFPRG
jgi:hypothetical protein